MTAILEDISEDTGKPGIRWLYYMEIIRRKSGQMFQNLYRWIQDLAVWLVISAAALQALPGKNYGKYVRFFTGLVTVLLLISPILKLTGTDQTLEELWNIRQQEEQQAEEEKFQKLLEEASASDLTGTRARQYEGNEQRNKELTDAAASQIRVEEIEIGK